MDDLCRNPADTALESSCRHKKEKRLQSTNIHCTTWSIYIRGRSKPKSGNKYPLHIMVTCMATDQLADDPFEEIIHDFSQVVPSVYIRIGRRTNYLLFHELNQKLIGIHDLSQEFMIEKYQ